MIAHNLFARASASSIYYVRAVIELLHHVTIVFGA